MYCSSCTARNERKPARARISATLTNIIIVIVGAGLAFISDKKLASEALALSVGIIPWAGRLGGRGATTGPQRG
jgi:hypothetical protein